MLKAQIYKLRPTKEQSSSLEQIFWNVRFVYNRALNTKINTYEESWKNISAYEIMRKLTVLKKKEWMEWLSLAPIHALQHSIKNVDRAFVNFFKRWSWFPNFKNKNSLFRSFHIPQWIKLDHESNMVFIPKIQRVKFFKDRCMEWEIRNATISKKASWYYISITYETWKPKESRKWVGTVGIDLWIKDFVVTSDWYKVTAPFPLKNALGLLRRKQRHLERQKKWSKRRGQTKKEIARLHEKIANIRKDFLHKLSTDICDQYDTICVEDLNVSGMIKNRKLSRHIADVGRWTFWTMLSYKANNVIKIWRYEPSSKMCSSCGFVRKRLLLSERTWTCGWCEARHDRDINAAINIKNIWVRASLTVGNVGH
jgi:putative transposase